MNEWVSTLADMPQIKHGYNHVTVTVIAKLKNGDEIKAFAADDTWHYDGNCLKIHQPVIAWKSL